MSKIFCAISMMIMFAPPKAFKPDSQLPLKPRSELPLFSCEQVSLLCFNTVICDIDPYGKYLFTRDDGSDIDSVLYLAARNDPESTLLILGRPSFTQEEVVYELESFTTPERNFLFSKNGSVYKKADTKTSAITEITAAEYMENRAAARYVEQYFNKRDYEAYDLTNVIFVEPEINFGR